MRALGTTGSPLSEDAQRWGTEQFEKIGTPDIWWCNISGGTDFAGAFIGGNRELPQVPGEMQCRLLGCAVEAWNEQGQPVIGEVGELVCTQPIPSMPLYFWGDEGNAALSLVSYFDMYPGVWRHGDWLKITPSGGCIIYGRSDATINRHGLRMGTSELYSAVEALPEVLDSMVVDLEYLGRESYMPLFVVLRPGVALDDAMSAKINNADQDGAVAALRARRDLPGGRDPAHAVGQEAGTADQEAAAGPAAGEGRQPGCDGQSGLPGLVRGFRAAACRNTVPKRQPAGSPARCRRRRRTAPASAAASAVRSAVPRPAPARTPA